jgi:hypothetical protein
VDNQFTIECIYKGFSVNEWHKESKQEINKKIITLVVMLAAATSLAILFALVAAHTGYVFG